MAITREIYNTIMRDEYMKTHPGAYETKQQYIGRMRAEHAQLSKQLAILEQHIDREMLDEPIPGPTQRELNNNEALHNAWDEMLVIWRLTNGHKGE